jgi:cytohesin
VITVICAPATAHETDQFTVPTGKVFADVGDELTAIFYTGIEDAVNDLNTRLRHATEAGRGQTFIDYLQSPETFADTVYNQYAAAWFMINRVEKMVHGDQAMRRKHPGRVIGYWESIHNVFTGVYHPLDLRQLWRIFHACMMDAYGSYIGPDKIGHFTDMGWVYYTIRRDALAAGDTEAEAHAKVLEEGTRGLVLGEEGMLGYLSAGIYSNADLSSNYAGMKFYMNLTQPVRIKGVMRPPMVVRHGQEWAISSHVRADSDFISWFVSDHWNEALNPGLFVPGMQDKVRRVVRMRSQRILDFYADDNGNRRTSVYFNTLMAELSTWYGEDYGHQGTLDELVGIGNTCFGEAPQAPDERSDIGYTSLHWGVVSNDRPVVLAALDAGTPVDEPVRSLESRSAEWGSSALHLAAAAGQVGMAKLLLDRGASVNMANDNGATPLHRAIEHPAVVALLIDRGAEVNASDGRGRTPLHWAARYTDTRTVASLLDSGADVEATDHAGETPLHRAAMWGQIQLMEAVIAAGADIDARANFDTTPLHFAVRGRQPGSLRFLVDHGATLDTRDEFGVTPLHDAARDGRLALVGALLNAGADADAADNYGSTPLHVSARYGHEAVAADLLAHGVRINTPNRFGSLPLHEAAFASCTPLIKLLLASGADTTARNRNGESPIDLAAAGGLSVAVLIMRSSGSPAGGHGGRGEAGRMRSWSN